MAPIFASLSFFALLSPMNALKLAIGECQGDLLPGTDVCGGGSVPDCNEKYVKVNEGYFAQCKMIDSNCLTSEKCQLPPPKPEKQCYERSTPDNKKYTGEFWELASGAKKAVAFSIKAKNDAHVRFFDGSKKMKKSYEIAIGGWRNKQSVIRKCTKGQYSCSIKKKLRKNKGFNGGMKKKKNFWASCQDGTIQWGKGSVVGERVQQTWTDGNPMACKYVDIMTGWGSAGKWNFCVLPPQKACYQRSTPDNKKYTGEYWPLASGPKKAVSFTVKAKNDAHVRFFDGSKSMKKSYEIVIGGWRNKQSVIRKCTNSCSNKDKIRKNSGFNGGMKKEKAFWASCEGGTLQWGSGSVVGESVQQTWTDGNPTACEYVDIMTGWGSSGKWNFCVLP